jgi:hypothetical protein
VRDLFGHALDSSPNQIAAVLGDGIGDGIENLSREMEGVIDFGIERRDFVNLAGEWLAGTFGDSRLRVWGKVRRVVKYGRLCADIILRAFQFYFARVLTILRVITAILRVFPRGDFARGRAILRASPRLKDGLQVELSFPRLAKPAVIQQELKPIT